MKKGLSRIKWGSGTRWSGRRISWCNINYSGDNFRNPGIDPCRGSDRGNLCIC